METPATDAPSAALIGDIDWMPPSDSDDDDDDDEEEEDGEEEEDDDDDCDDCDEAGDKYDVGSSWYFIWCAIVSAFTIWAGAFKSDNGRRYESRTMCKELVPTSTLKHTKVCSASRNISLRFFHVLV